MLGRKDGKGVIIREAGPLLEVFRNEMIKPSAEDENEKERRKRAHNESLYAATLGLSPMF